VGSGLDIGQIVLGGYQLFSSSQGVQRFLRTEPMFEFYADCIIILGPGANGIDKRTSP
jgi:hypothetical protein